jgi:AcrR family transcriptional regulator
MGGQEPDRADGRAGRPRETTMSSESPTRAPLSRADVIAQARAIIEADGLDQLSLRRLADRLGVTAPALYAHVASKDDLVQAVTDGELDAIIGNLQAREDDPVAALRQLCLDYVDHALAHPHLYRALATHPPWQGVVEAAGGDGGGERSALTDRFKVIYDTVADAVARGALRPVEPMVALLVLWTAVHGLVEVLLLDVIPVEELRRRLVDEVIGSTIAGLSAP